MLFIISLYPYLAGNIARETSKLSELIFQEDDLFRIYFFRIRKCKD